MCSQIFDLHRGFGGSTSFLLHVLMNKMFLFLFILSLPSLARLEVCR